MRRTIVICLLLASCREAPPDRGVPEVARIRTIESVDPRPVVIDPPPVLRDEAPPPKPKALPWETPQPVLMTPEDEQLRASLPFSPAIGLDPVDGSKISIRATTPMTEYKNKLYYFSSEANKRTFLATPEQYTKGAFSHL